MSSQISTATRRLAAALALAAVVTLGVSVASPTDAASAASMYSTQSGTSAVHAGSVAASDRRLPTGRLYIAPRYFDRDYAGGVVGAANDVCNSYRLGDQCFKSLQKLLSGPMAGYDDCQVHGMDAVIPYIQYSRCRKS